ncbi:unnamed protein product [Clonostachys byssicola]|uniref:F-box domain-containing protein n=1 Tax=Clonostachys byssicola TaxID=160290 RepID=A0A9N9Y2S6_9HYPO|nr:unnamed protein product [Clonostachys byssicola]
MEDIWAPPNSLTDLHSVYNELQQVDAWERNVLSTLNEDQVSEDDQDNPSRVTLYQGPSEGYSQSQDSHLVVLRRIDEQRRALRSRAMDLSRPHLRGIKITQLPQELLTWIFSLFQHSALNQNRIGVEDIGRKFAKSDYETLKNLRLVCHLFDQIATPFLLPIIRVQLNQSSLERVQSISRNPRLKSGIRGIQLFIGCRLKIHASSKFEFFTHQQRIARQLFDYNAFMYHRARQRSSDGLADVQGWGEERLLMLDRIRACVLACDRFLGTSPLPALGRLDIPHSEFPPRLKEQVDESLIDECETILHRAYEYNKAEYLRDWPVVSEKQLSDALAQLISLQNLPISLSIVEIPPFEQYFDSFLDTQKAFNCLTRPLRLSEIGKLKGKPIGDEIAAYTRVFWDLPIAIYQAGSLLRGFELKGPTVSERYSMICPEEMSCTPEKPVWNQLHVVCQDLQTLIIKDLTFNYWLDDETQPVGDNEEQSGQVPHAGLECSIGKYVGSMLSGRRFEKVELDMSLRGSRPNTPQKERCPLGYVLSRASWPRARAISLKSVIMTQRKMELFCGSMNPDVEELNLSDILLSQGSWAPVLDLLRELLKQRCMEGKCRVRLIHLAGGEVGQLADDILSASVVDDMTPLEASTSVMESFSKYITGDEVGQNPAIARRMI